VTESETPGARPSPLPGPQLPSIEELYLTRTALTGALPDVVPRESQLRVLYAWNVDINSEAPWLLGSFSGEPAARRGRGRGAPGYAAPVLRCACHLAHV
jgi:hypothetical protein